MGGVVERFIRTLKSEGTRQITVPITFVAMRQEVALIIIWYNRYRPHQSLYGGTPDETYHRIPPMRAIPIKANSELPALFPQVSYLEGRRHLPIIEMKRAT